MQDNCLHLTLLARFLGWPLSNDDHRETVIVRGTPISDDSDTLIERATAGIGIRDADECFIVREFVAGTLVPILPDGMLDTDHGVRRVRPALEFVPAPTEAFASGFVERFEHGAPRRRTESDPEPRPSSIASSPESISIS